jgi:hypothetical protein
MVVVAVSLATWVYLAHRIVNLVYVKK